MADIDVVPKHRTKLWLWIVVALAIIVILWVMLGRNTTSPTGRIDGADPSPALASIPSPTAGT